MKGKRGQGLSMNTIVIAVIVLFVMVVLLLIFTGRINLFVGGLKDCQNTLRGVCSESPNCANIPDSTVLQTAKEKEGDKQGCLPEQRYCCLSITGKTS